MLVSSTSGLSACYGGAKASWWGNPVLLELTNRWGNNVRPLKKAKKYHIIQHQVDSIVYSIVYDTNIW